MAWWRVGSVHLDDLAHRDGIADCLCDIFYACALFTFVRFAPIHTHTPTPHNSELSLYICIFCTHRCSHLPCPLLRTDLQRAVLCTPAHSTGQTSCLSRYRGLGRRTDDTLVSYPPSPEESPHKSLHSGRCFSVHARHRRFQQNARSCRSSSWSLTNFK